MPRHAKNRKALLYFLKPVGRFFSSPACVPLNRPAISKLWRRLKLNGAWLFLRDFAHYA